MKNADKYGVDKKRVVVTGGSAGGHLALMVGMTPKSAKLGPSSKVAAVVNFFGITDVGDQTRWPAHAEVRGHMGARAAGPLRACAPCVADDLRPEGRASRY